MLPNDIPESCLTLPPGDRHKAVIVSGGSLRHLQFGYQLQDRFPELLVGWWIPGRPAGFETRPRSKGARALEMLRGGEFSGLVRKIGEVVVQRREDWRWEAAQRAAEERMFAGVVGRLRATAAVHPIAVSDLNGDDVLDGVLSASPYFLLTLGGPLLLPRLFRAVRGLAINQHSGWSPQYKGAHTPHAALYHRDVRHVGNTVHLLDSGADSGPILRRSSVKVHPDDSVHDIFMAAIALGTELTLEVLDQALRAETLPLFPQPHGGRTYLTSDMNRARRQRIERDLRSGWLAESLADEQNW